MSVAKDLGIFVDNRLKFDYHIQQMVSKAARVLWMLKRSIVVNRCEIKKLLYTTIVRPILEYGSQLWSPYIKKYVYSIESVQRCASRFILNYPDLNYHQRLRRLNVLPLVYRREMLDITMFYKIINDKTPLNSREYCTLNVNTRYNVRYCNLLSIPFAKTDQYKYSYFIRVLHLWKKLPQEIRMINFGRYGTSFKRNLRIWFDERLHNIFDCENYCTWTNTCRCLTCNLR